SVDTSGSTSDTDGMTCDLEEVKDTLAFTYVTKFDTGIPDPVLQATYYNGDADEVMIMSFSGKARRFALDGTPLSDVFDVPPEAQPQLDGATYDPILGRGLLITQSCVLTEVEPQTLAVIESKALGFGMSICAGLALGLDDHVAVRRANAAGALAATRPGARSSPTAAEVDALLAARDDG
ncbi:MAG: hypothetical protein KDB35_11075, partial [Acidimicrobiales bacterium]|nr:hypothetical protein [Acidimicrobiales bacterium]